MKVFNENYIEDVIIIYDDLGKDPLRLYNYKPIIDNNFNYIDEKVLELIKNTVINFIIIGEDKINTSNEKQKLVFNLNKIDKTWKYKLIEYKSDNLIFLLLQNSDNTFGYIIEIQDIFWNINKV